MIKQRYVLYDNEKLYGKVTVPENAADRIYYIDDIHNI